jgi:hypothetical protein
MRLSQWIQAGVARTRAERLEVRQRAANAVRHPARNNRALASWEQNPGRVALAAYERCRRKICHQLAKATVAMYIAGEQERAIDMMRNVDLVVMYGHDLMLLIEDMRYLAMDYGITEEQVRFGVPPPVPPPPRLQTRSSTWRIVALARVPCRRSTMRAAC